MKVIIEHDEKAGTYLAQTLMPFEYLSPMHKIIDITPEDLIKLDLRAYYIEPNFLIMLCQIEALDQIPVCSNRLLVTIGKAAKDDRIDVYYNMSTHVLKQVSTVQGPDDYQWIHCSSDTDQICAADYIHCIYTLKNILNSCHKPAVIYADLYASQETYRYRSLTSKIISNYLKTLNGILINKTTKGYKHYTPCNRCFEPYVDYALYLETPINESLSKVMPYLSIPPNQAEAKAIDENPRQTYLYDNNVFYQSIPYDLEIYVPLNMMHFKDPDYYETLGLKHIPLIGNYGMLYAERSKFDELSEVLKQDISHPYYNPVLSHQVCYKTVLNQNFSYHLTDYPSEYKGKGVYIGVISTDYIDYTNPVFRLQDGRSRIACIWDQINADEGYYYLQEQITSSLIAPHPGQLIPLPNGDSISTMLLGIAGGESAVPHYKGIATEAEFVAAKVNTAPEPYQKIYGGTPIKEAVTMADVLIAVIKLINFASERGKPLVLCIPFNTNIDAHDGAFDLNEILGTIATKERVTIIIPTGEEADKMHHYRAEGQQPAISQIDIRVPQSGQNVIGIAYQRFSTIVSALLYPPPGIAGQPINLKTRGISQLNDTFIYSNGYNISPLNGAIRMFFRIDNPAIGIWKLELTQTTELSSEIDLWISQQEMNKHITLHPSSPLITIGSLGNIRNTITVGGYDAASMVVLRSSGRGFSWDNRVEPNFITHASRIIAPCQIGQWASVSGTMAAAGIIAGVAASVYTRCIDEEITPLPNTLVMDTLILGTIRQFEGIEFPNPSYGYGVFDLEMLNTLLTKPLPL